MFRLARCRIHIRRSSCLLLAFFTAACAQRAPTAAPRPPDPIDTLVIRTHTRVLAHDSLLGRGTGTAEKRAAARYIAEQMGELGLTALDGSHTTAPADYLDAVPLLRVDVSAATLTVGTNSSPHGSGWVLGRFGREGMRAVSGPVARLGADSTAVRPGTWLLLDAGLGEAAVRWVPEWRSRGVIGLITRVASDADLAGWYAHLADIRWQLAEGAADPVWQADLPTLMVGPAIGVQLDAPEVRVAFEPNARAERVTDYNVVGVLPGSNPQAAPVLLTAHYDHLGVRAGSGSDSIFNGFSDNAAGVAMLLAIARSAKAAPPPRPLVFLFTAAEEVGLLGSIHFVHTHPTLVDGAHALVNLDAGAPPAPPTRWRLAGATRSAAGPIAASTVEAHGWAHRSDGGSPNSDHWPFMLRGVPAVFLIPDGGFEGVSEEQTARLLERWDRYHRADDEWAADFPFAGLGRYASLALAIVYALAEAELPR